MEVTVLSTKLKTHKCFDFEDVSFGKDIISQLPDGILHHILSFLPAADTVRTSALSTRWRPLSTFFTIADLYFDDRCAKEQVEKFFKTELPERVRCCCLALKEPVDAFTINLWVDKLAKRKVEELFLVILCQTLFPMPDNIFNSESLTSLELQILDYPLIVPDYVCFPRLKKLILNHVKFDNDHSVQRLLSGCLVLEELELDYHFRTLVNEITISLPSLQTLTIYGSRAFKVVLLDVSSLTHANLFLRDCETLSALALLAGLRGVKSLVLSSDTLEAISFAENLLANLPTFYNLTTLKVHEECCSCAEVALVCILQQSPILDALHLWRSLDPYHRTKEDQTCNRIPQSFKCSLKEIHISNFEGSEDEIDFVKYVLENAIYLEKMEISWSMNQFADMEIQEDIRQLSRGSTNCVIKFSRYY